ncbi:interferon alpha/beta receptor 1 isoform X2 [Dromiciops gliroides]|uniref:interferon alpha/beta receptor 1 isoform X2 n=1 Tax=Dromiciops gliroides TaxID=33562 RepID=UPI001CC62828|nr:interferon alpha/beta receptor 1 isoform X2 [Dromiciops gliroides]
MLSCTPAAVLVLMVASRDWSLFPIAAGEKNLKSPQNVNVEIVDHNFILKWNWDDEPNSNVTFSAYYQNPDKMSNWIQLIGCQNVTGTKCTSTLTSITIFEKIRVRIRTEKGHETSPWYNVSSFVPYQIAQIGPPEVQLEAEDRAIKIIISPPGTINSSMWVTDSFTYNLVIWKNSSSVEKINLTVYHRDTIYDLSPETTYCLKVQARLRKQKKIGSYSPVLCINTTAEHIPPRPKNVEVDAAYNKYVLKWDYPYENMNFQVQYLLGYYKRSPADYSNKWKTISDCKNIISRQCDLSKEIKEGIFYLRVRASNGTITSFWSERKLDTNIKTRIDPPSIEVKSSEDSLSVYIRENSGKSEKIPMSQDYPLIYEVTYWENASNIENKMIVKEKLCKVSDLQPLVLYCFKVKALLESDKNNKSSEFSNVVCSKITPVVLWSAIEKSPCHFRRTNRRLYN